MKGSLKALLREQARAQIERKQRLRNKDHLQWIETSGFGYLRRLEGFSMLSLLTPIVDFVRSLGSH